MKVSVVVPTYNRNLQLVRLLKSFEKLKEVIPIEIIIVDDSSNDETRITLEKWKNKKHKFKAKAIILDKNSGPAVARNAGIEEAIGDYIAFTDSDCIVSPYWIKHLKKSVMENGELVGIGGRVLPLSNDIYSHYYTFHRILEPPKTLKYLVSCNCIFNRKEILYVKGFDEDILKPGGEDIGLSFKLYKKGMKFAFEESAIVYHDYRNSTRNFAKTFYNYGFGCRIVTEKYFGGK